MDIENVANLALHIVYVYIVIIMRFRIENDAFHLCLLWPVFSAQVIYRVAQNV